MEERRSIHGLVRMLWNHPASLRTSVLSHGLIHLEVIMHHFIHYQSRVKWVMSHDSQGIVTGGPPFGPGVVVKGCHTVDVKPID